MKPVTLRDMIQELEYIAKQYPEMLDKPVIYARDSEGNGYSYKYYTAILAEYTDDGYIEADPKNYNVTLIN